MDWNAAIEHNRAALKRVLGMLVGMAGFAGFTSPLREALSHTAASPPHPARTSSSPPSPRWGEETAGIAAAPSSPLGERTRDERSDGERVRGQSPSAIIPPPEGRQFSRPTLPRHLHRAVLRLLRPAEAAARRLVIVAARGLVLSPVRPRRRKPKPAPLFLRRGDRGTGIVLPMGFAPHPGAVKGGGAGTPARRLSFQLLDPLPRHRASRPISSGVPRISVPGLTRRLAVPLPLSPDDPIDAARLAMRLQALASALDDLPEQARRFARWRDRCRRNVVHRVWPLRPGRPPGLRKKHRHEVHDLLANTQGLALWALERRDTS